MHYCGEFTTELGREAEAFLRGTYTLMFKGLSQAAAKEASPS